MRTFKNDFRRGKVARILPRDVSGCAIKGVREEILSRVSIRDPPCIICGYREY